jgi:hypothetical protein
MEQKYIIKVEPVGSDRKFYLMVDKDTYLSMLTHESKDVFTKCWTEDRSKGTEFTELEVQQVMHGVESVLMVPDDVMGWEEV